MAATITGWFFESTKKEDEEIEEDLETFRKDVRNQLTSIQKDIEEIKRILDEKDNK
ncbi:MAG: hypothetical protein HVN34_05270 [Methanobacteriaceae archaeon]|nr:hypothetical protein [Methanobacteriaceae archaeon]OPY22867.1 MAG: hypothetical protein A4E26_01125 [Methanobacterium sp. PtaU1.Bin097]